MKAGAGVLSVMLLALVAGSATQAEPAVDAEGQKLVDDFLADVQTLQARFEQQLVDANDLVVERSSGTIDLQRPGKFRWSYTEPYEQLLIADGVNVWSYDVDLEQVTVKSQEEALGSTPALLLGGANSVLEDFDYVGSLREKDTVWAMLKPRDTTQGFDRVELGFTDGKLSRMLFGDNLQQTTLIALLDARFNESIDAAQFRFTPPPDVDVIGEAIQVPEPTDF